MIDFFVLTSLVAITLSMSLMVETSSWVIRVHAKKETTGQFIARTNIYLYGGRFFAILTQVAVGFMIDKGMALLQTISVFAIGFFLAVVTHLFFLANSNRRVQLEVFLIRWLGLTQHAESPRAITKSKLNKRLLFVTCIVSGFFSLALVAPLALAATFPEYRLTLNNAGATINFLGMLLLLGYLDPVMYKALDEGTISSQIGSYIYGRVCGFAGCGFFLALIVMGMA